MDWRSDREAHGKRTVFETDAAIEVGELVRTEARDTAPMPRPT